MKILLADDHELIRAGLRNELADYDATVEFVEACDAATLNDALDAHPDIDLALIDLGMPHMQGERTIAELRERHPGVRLIVLSAADPADAAHAMLRAGAAGFIPKTVVSGVLVQAIRLVLAGGRYLPPQMLQDIVEVPVVPDLPDLAVPPPAGADSATQAASPTRLGMLSERQRQVFALLAKGLPNKMIARQLNITEGTVKSHVSAIFDVLNVHNRVSAVAKAQRLAGDLEDPESPTD
jgi:DNA-binding NarL/FixJ family response regulator